MMARYDVVRVFLGAGAVLCTVLAGPVKAVPVQWTGAGSNGHWYETIAHGAALDWEAARAAAVTSGGYLATLTSAAEHVFVAANAQANSAAWGHTDWTPTGGFGPWIGGYQLANSSAPGANWQWVSGETWSYANWNTGEPNDAVSSPNVEDNSENYLHLFTGSDPQWNDLPLSGLDSVVGYVIEWDSLPAPAPATLPLLVLALPGLAVGLRRRRFLATC